MVGDGRDRRVAIGGQVEPGAGGPAGRLESANRSTKFLRARAAASGPVSISADQSGWAICIGKCSRSPVMTALSPASSISTETWPGVRPAVGISEIPGTTAWPGSTHLIRPASSID